MAGRKKANILRKKPMQDIGKRLTHAAILGASTTIAAYGANTFIPKVLPKLPKEYIGIGMLGLGLAGEVFLEEEHLVSVARGFTAYGSLLTTAEYILPKQKADLGLLGIGAQGSDNGVEMSIPSYNEQLALLEAEIDAMDGGIEGRYDYDDEIVSELAAQDTGYPLTADSVSVVTPDSMSYLAHAELPISMS